MANKNRNCGNCRYFVAKLGQARGHCAKKPYKYDEWGRELTVTRLRSQRACKKYEKDEVIIEYLKRQKARPEIKIIWSLDSDEICDLMKQHNCKSVSELAQLLTNRLDKEIPVGGVWAIVKEGKSDDA